MTDCKVTVLAGVCKMKTVIMADMDYETNNVKMTYESDCPMVRNFGALVTEVNFMSETAGALNESSVYKAAGTCIQHLSCPVPCAVCKAAEAASGMGLKRNVTITVE
jgi:hypothetical protein